MMDNRTFGAFIMTYERPLILKDTIVKILQQTLPPAKIMVVDNSLSDETKILVENMSHPAVEYFRVGHNSGPAKASQIGLSKLSTEGFKWIYWGDDDNPPEFSDAFELLIQLGDNLIKDGLNVGVVGAVGQYFTAQKGKIVRVKDEELITSDWLSVDFVAGGQTMIVNSKLAQDSLFADEKLFFGLEELDFCLKVKKSNYKLIVQSDLFRRSRVLHGKVNFKNKAYAKVDFKSLPRVYYSVRNLCFILWQHRLYQAFMYHLVKSLTKVVIGFRFGFEYGRFNSRMILKGIMHFLLNRGGKLVV